MNAPVSRLDDYRAPPPEPARAPPANVEAEQAFLGALLINNEVYAQSAAFLKVAHFSEEIHRRIYHLAATMIGEGRKATPVTLAPFLGEHDLGGVTIRQYLAHLCAEATTVINARDYARTISDMAARRAMIEAAGELIAQSSDAPIDLEPSMIASGALTALQRVVEDFSSKPSRRDPGELAAALVTRARAIQSGERRDDGISTGLPDLDRASGGGFRPGTLWITAGRPRMGKSILGSGFVRKVAERGLRDIIAGREGVGAQLWGLELSEEEQTARILADLAYSARRPVTFGQILEGRLDPEELWAVEDAQKRLGRLPLALELSARPTVAEIAAGIRREKARMAKKNVRLGLVVIDYLKFIKPTDRYRGNLVAEIGEITGLLKETAKAEGVCINLLAQVNRLVDSKERKDPRPTLGDLRGSGDLEADADVIIFIHRQSVTIKQSPEYRASDPDAYQAFLDCERKGEIIIGKTRVGAEGTVNIWIDAGASTFASAATHEQGECMF